MGQIVNLMTVDVMWLQDIPTFIHMLWSAPLITGVAMYFLWVEVGAAAFAGLGTMIILVPINVVVRQIYGPMIIEQMAHKDSRIKMTNEILSGIKVFIHSVIHSFNSHNFSMS